MPKKRNKPQRLWEPWEEAHIIINCCTALKEISAILRRTEESISHKRRQLAKLNPQIPFLDSRFKPERTYDYKKPPKPKQEYYGF